MPRSDVNGVRLSYRQSGKGPTVVLVHGLAANQAFWRWELIDALTREHQVLTLDLPGHGHSATPASGYRPSDLAELVGGLLDQLGIGQVHLVGHSFGGCVALQLALQQPGRMHSLTIADSRIRALQPEQVLPGLPDWAHLRRQLVRCGVTIDEDEPEIGLCLLEALASPRWDRVRERIVCQGGFVPFGGGGNARSAQRWRQLLANTTASSDIRVGIECTISQLQKLSVPVLAVYGQNSPNRRTACRLGALLPGCQVVLVPGGHFHPATQPERFQRELQAFLRMTSQSVAVQESVLVGCPGGTPPPLVAW